ncbi:hypothetical protein FGO68_gene9798 [Halteria grandinella]|uniref:C2H2-type domain-containing protein n=1 Tax=Halteria grandinella TaxID=5974 RepID=A0A8J8NH81_HALGN|nr:hypothetical protein FGO68_gene9798 [Halteria grandinella]
MKERKYECPFCDLRCHKQDDLVVHLRKHEKARPFKCARCVKRFASVGNLNRHFIVHSQKKLFHCPICEKEFKYKSSLKLHMQRLHEQKPKQRYTKTKVGFQCKHKDCGLMFKNLRELQMHHERYAQQECLMVRKGIKEQIKKIKEQIKAQWLKNNEMRQKLKEIRVDLRKEQKLHQKRIS